MRLKIFSIALACATALAFGASAQAAEFKSGDFLSFLRGTTSTGDIYAAGQNIALDQTVQGDAMLAGMNVRVTGDVAGSVMAAGSYVDVLGKVGHAVRAVGSRVSVDADVAGDALVAGGMVYVPQNAVIRGDLYMGSGVGVIDGTVLGNVKIGGGQVAINGDVRGNVDATVDDLTLGDAAKVGGKLKYSSAKMARIMSTGTIAGGLDYTRVEKPKAEAPKMPKATPGQRVAAMLMALIFGFAVWSVASLLAIWLFKERVSAAANLMYGDFAKHVGWGFVWLVVVPVACLVLLVSVVGSAAGLFLGLVFALTVVAAKAVAGPAVGWWLLRKYSKDKKRALDWKAVLLGVFLVQLVWAVPVLGWLACLVVFLAALGAVMMLLKPLAK